VKDNCRPNPKQKIIVMSKLGSIDGSATRGKRERKSVTLDEKVDLKRYERNEHKAGMANAAGIP
jgi:hypothetical protein